MAIAYSYRLKPIPSSNDLVQGIDVGNNMNTVTFTASSLQEAMPISYLTQGSLWIGGENNRITELPLGLPNQVLTSDGTTVEWAYAGGEGNTTYTLTTSSTPSAASLVLTSSSGDLSTVEVLPGANIDVSNSGADTLIISLAQSLKTSPSYGTDAEAAAGGVAIGDFYRNGSIVQIRIT